MAGGRPTKYKQEYCEECIAFMAKGFSFEAFAGHIKVAIDTLSKWVNEYPEFSAAKKIGQAESRKWWETLGMGGAAGKLRGFNAAVWIFTMKNRFGWKDNLAISSDQEIAILTSYDHKKPIADAANQ